MEDALAKLGDSTIVPALAERIASPDWTVRLGAYRALAHLGPEAKAALPALLAALGSSDFEERALAAETIGWIREPSVSSELVKVLGQNSWSAAEQAALALERMTARGAVPALQDAARKHWSRRVRTAAAQAASQIQRRGKAAVLAHDFHDVDRARRVLAALAGKDGCPGSRESGWRVRRGPRLLTLRAGVGGPSAPTLLPAVLPAIRLGHDNGFKEQMKGHSVADGWLVTQDAGEWGGVLWFVDWEGRTTQLLDHPMEAFVDFADDVVTLGPLAHPSRSAGWVVRLVRAGKGEWKSEPWLELPSAPLAWAKLDEQTLVVVSAAGAVELSGSGAVKELACVAPKSR